MKHDAVNVRPSGEFRGQLSAQSRKGTLNYSMKYEDLGALCSGGDVARTQALPPCLPSLINHSLLENSAG